MTPSHLDSHVTKRFHIRWNQLGQVQSIQKACVWRHWWLNATNSVRADDVKIFFFFLWKKVYQTLGDLVMESKMVVEKEMHLRA